MNRTGRAERDFSCGGCFGQPRHVTCGRMWMGVGGGEGGGVEPNRGSDRTRWATDSSVERQIATRPVPIMARLRKALFVEDRRGNGDRGHSCRGRRLAPVQTVAGAGHGQDRRGGVGEASSGRSSDLDGRRGW